MNRRDEGNRDDGRAAAAATVADMFRARCVSGGKAKSPLSRRRCAVRDWWKFE